jgi:hypothetical protein
MPAPRSLRDVHATLADEHRRLMAKEHRLVRKLQGDAA